MIGVFVSCEAIALVACVVGMFLVAGSAQAGPGYEGFGSRTLGGTGGKVFWVDPALSDAGPDAKDDHAGTKSDPCSLRKALSGGKRIVRFVSGGTITLRGDIEINDSFVTIDGASAPAPGITITHTHEEHGGLVLDARDKHVHDLIVSHIRFKGLWAEHPVHKV
ncbi:unnamed protein product, partial [marine sediment metagenome]